LAITREPGLRAELTSAARPLLEREGELAALHAAVDSARRGDGRLVVIEGAAGIGKTRLLAEVRSLAAEFDVLTARAGELESDFAFGIVRQLFEPVFAAARPADRDELLSGAAAPASRLFASRPDHADREGTETLFAILHGLYWLAANFAFRRPTLLAVDDLHWTDEPSLRWLGYLARRIEGLPLLLVTATRPPGQATKPALVTEVVADPLAIVIRPAALGQESATTLAHELFGLDLDDGFADALLEASGGNPLYLTALLDAVARERIAPTAEQVPRMLELGGEALSGGVALRLSRLPRTAVSFVRAAAILGDQTELTLAASLADLDASTALDAAKALRHADLLQRENPIAFTHPVVRSAVLEDIDARERMRLHRRAAEVLLDSGALPEKAATYLTQMVPDHDPFVVATLRRAAARSLSQGAPDAAVVYLRRALEEPPESDDLRNVLGELGTAELEAFENEAAADHLGQALAELDGISERPDLVLSCTHALSALANRTSEVIALLEQLGDCSLGDREIGEQIEGLLIAATHYDGELYPIARERWNVASTRDVREPIQAGVLLARGALEEARRGISRPRAIKLAQRALASDATRLERVYLVDAIHSLTVAGATEEAASAVAVQIEQARREGDHVSCSAHELFRAILRSEQGELLAAEEDLSLTGVIQLANLAPIAPIRAGLLAEVLVLRGEGTDAEALVANFHAGSASPGHQLHFLRGRGCVYLETSRPERALADFGRAGTIARSIGIENPAFSPWRSLSALALHRLGRVDEARELAQEELELSRRWGAPRAVGVSLRALGLVRGGPSGEQLLREAVEVLARSPARLEHARALIDLGGALRRANRRSEAQRYLRDAIDLAHECGATAVVAWGNVELRATGAYARKVMLSGLESLTPSERRVAQMAAEELSNKEIAQALFVTVKTVEVHLSRVYRKLDIESRRQLASALSAPAGKAAPPS
jgi:DNA-binding CsgD family transcriptional regulator